MIKLISISGNIHAIAKVNNHDMYANELNFLSECITKQAERTMRKTKMGRNRSKLSLDIPAQLASIESIGNENCDGIETIVLREQAEHERPKSVTKLSTFRNNWI